VTVELRGISKQFGSAVALDDINLLVEEGQFVTLLGPTGCGKSTLLRIIAGFAEPSAGEVLIGGEVMNDVPARRRHVGMLFQNYALFPHMTVEQNVGFGLRMQGMNKKEIGERIDRMLPMVGIEGLRERYPSQLSGGQQQRTALARTLAIEPRVLLLDEPMAALDRKLKLEMQGELKKLVMRLGITTVCVSHDQDEALTMSDQIAVLHDGKLEQFGTPLELYDRPQSGFTAGFLGRSNLLPGKLITDDQGQLMFCAEKLSVPIASNTIPSGAATMLLVRPEHLLIDADAPSSSALAGVVSFITHYGHSMHYEVALDAGPVFLVAAMRPRDSTPLPQGSRVFLTPSSPSAFQVIAR
jgi:putative spermidine/putrescine transport system ATP-binding protein